MPRPLLCRLAGFLLPVFALLVGGCPGDQEYDRVNVDTDCLPVLVSPLDTSEDDSSDDDDSAASGEAGPVSGDDDDSAASLEEEAGFTTIDLVGRTGYFDISVIGSATLTPAEGPAGTRFDLAVQLVDTGNDTGNPTGVVHRATVLVDNGSLTLNEFDLSESPADESRWVLTLEAGGDPLGTRRTDELCVALYTEI